MASNQSDLKSKNNNNSTHQETTEKTGCDEFDIYSEEEQTVGEKKEKEKENENDETRKLVKNYYGKQLKTNQDLKSAACCSSVPVHPLIQQAIDKIPQPVLDKFYGCGTPLPLGIQGLTVLDLGSGSGRDCYIASALVGPNGNVIGVDMTEEQLKVANENIDTFMNRLGYSKRNIKFVHGYIENLQRAGIKDNSIDLIISNCVINLSADKPAVLRSAWQSLNVGGEFHFSDIYCDRRLSSNIKQHPVLYGECLGGALYIGDFYRICNEVGFIDPRILSISLVPVSSEFQEIIGNANFYSITFRLFKLPSMEPEEEDYGQIAIYKGTMKGYNHKYSLDHLHVFETERPVLVSGNTASMLGESWLKPYFKIIGDRSNHYGRFPISNNRPAFLVPSSVNTTYGSNTPKSIPDPSACVNGKCGSSSSSSSSCCGGKC